MSTQRTDAPRGGNRQAPHRDGDPTIVVRDLRNVPYYRVHNLIIDDYGPLLHTDGLAIYSTLCLMADFETQKCWPSLVGMAAHWGMSKSTVIRVVELMQDLRLILIERGKQENGAKANNTYFLLEPLPLEEAVIHLRQALWERGRQQVDKARKAGTDLDEKQRRKYEDIDRHILDLLPGGLVALRSQATFRSRDRWQQFLAALPPLSTTDPGGTAGYLQRTDAYRRGITEYLRGTGEDRGGLSGYQDVPSGTTGGLAEYQKKNPEEHPQKQNHEPATNVGGGVFLITDEEIETYPLGEDEVLVVVDHDQGTLQPWCIDALVRRDLDAAHAAFGIPTYSTCYYTIDQVFGEATEPSETIARRKQEVRTRTEQRLKTTYREIGAYSVREALARYFTASIAEGLCPAEDTTDEQRVYDWLRYVQGDQGRGIENPAGYLRSRLSSGEWAPPPPARPGRR